MRISKKIKQVLLLFFLLEFLSSCGDRCIDEDEFYDQQLLLYANPNDEESTSEKTPIYGEYNHADGGQTREWKNTGLLSNGEGFRIWISGEVLATNGENVNKDNLKNFSACKLCFKEKNSTSIQSDNCYCGPFIDKGVYQYETPESEPNKQDDTANSNYSSFNCLNNQNDQNDINKCSCKIYTGSKYLHDNDFISFDKNIFKKQIIDGNPISLTNKSAEHQMPCKLSMGYGLYISLWGVDGYTVPQKAYHLFTTSKIEGSDGKRFCPINIFKTDECVDENGNSKWIFVYNSPDDKIFKKNENEFHAENEKIKINFYDQFYEDNKGYYKLQFIKGAWQQKENGLLAGIVTEMEEFLFGTEYYDQKSAKTIKKVGVVEFLYKAVLKDQYIGRIINIGFVLYITFFGMAFLMGVVELSKKELMIRLLKIGLVMMFTSPTAWQMYNTYVVSFFKVGMDSIVSLITDSYSSIIESSYREKGVIETGNFKAGSNFIYIDGLIKDLLSDPATKKIFSLLNMDNGKGFFAIIYIPAIYFLIFYFIYAMLDVAIKYLINLIKICIGLALGPVFIFFSLFEKTKDMFKNWLAFMGSRSLEIVILFALLHPFITIIDVLFRQELLHFKVCPIGLNDEYKHILSFKTFLRPQSVHSRSIFDWFEIFLKIGAMIFITKSLADRSSYISGQLVSIGGISNADPVSEVGKGEGGFSMGSQIVRGALSVAKQAISSKYIGGYAAKALRVGAKGITKAMRQEIVRDKSVNDLFNYAFRAVGIRNRGLRSFMRDRQIDKFIGEANIIADQKGLVQGKDRDEFVRNMTMEKANMYINSNKNQAAILGIDYDNMAKRMDQKLVKEPMKNFIKSEAQRQKIEGKIGLEAEKEIMLKTKKWAKDNFINEERAVSEFFKKKSIKSYIKSQSLMSASNAFEYAKHLRETDTQKYDQFVEKFRDATNQNAIRRRIRIDKREKKFFGKVQNKINQVFTEAKNVNSFSDSAYKSNPKKTLRKFDRKLKRLEDAKNKPQDPSVSTFKKMSNATINEQFEFLKINDKDSVPTKVVKFLPNILSRPITQIAKSYNNRRVNKKKFEDYHTENQFESYRRLGYEFKNDEKSYRQSRREIEQIIKKIDKLSEKNPNYEKKTHLENLSPKDRIKFQEVVNNKISDLGSEINKIHDDIKNKEEVDNKNIDEYKQQRVDLQNQIKILTPLNLATIDPAIQTEINQLNAEINNLNNNIMATSSDLLSNKTQQIALINQKKDEIEKLKNAIFKNCQYSNNEKSKFKFLDQEFEVTSKNEPQDSASELDKPQDLASSKTDNQDSDASKVSSKESLENLILKGHLDANKIINS